MAAFATASLAALAYGFLYSFRGEGAARAVLKVSGVAILALIAFASGAMWFLWAALAASAVGDAFLAGKQERWLLPGMAAFFLAHVFYVIVFCRPAEAPPQKLPSYAVWFLYFFGQAAITLGLLPPAA